MKLNNKGQSLVMFVLIIPIILLIFVLLIDIGKAIYEKNRLSNTGYLCMDYALDNINNIDENDVIKCILKDSDSLSNISVNIYDNNAQIKIEKKLKGFLGESFDFDLTTVKCEYKGTINDEEKNIERIK